jgi:hypothetical protein
MPGARPWREAGARFWAPLAGLALVDSAAILWDLRDASFRTDAWVILHDAPSLSAFVSHEATEWLDPTVPRIRPVFHLVMASYVWMFGLSPVGLAWAFWGLAVVLAGLEVAVLVRLGFRPATALLAGLAMLSSTGFVTTTDAHQYNDLVCAAVFAVSAVLVTIGEKPGRTWLVLLLTLLAIGCHESGLVTGGMIALAGLFRPSPESFRDTLLRDDRRWALVACAAYGTARLTLGAHGADGLMGISAVGSNLVTLGGFFAELLAPGVFPLWLVLALFLVWRGHARRPGRVVVLAVAWALLSYAPYLLNQRYQSATYFCVAPLLVLALVIDPVVTWAERWTSARRVRRVLVAVCLMAAVHGMAAVTRVGHADRLGKAALQAILATAPREGSDLRHAWIFEDRGRLGTWKRSFMEEELAVYSPGSSVALKVIAPEKAFRIHLLDVQELDTHPSAPGDVRLLVDGSPGRLRLWRVGEPRVKLYP